MGLPLYGPEPVGAASPAAGFALQCCGRIATASRDDLTPPAVPPANGRLLSQDR
jgi:hypothetical protein